MKKFAAFAFLAGVGLFAATSAQAVPLAPLTQGGVVTLVAGGCGEGRHRGTFGGCRRNWANPGAHNCPRGYHIGPGGHCRGNGR